MAKKCKCGHSRGKHEKKDEKACRKCDCPGYSPVEAEDGYAHGPKCFCASCQITKLRMELGGIHEQASRTEIKRAALFRVLEEKGIVTGDEWDLKVRDILKEDEEGRKKEEVSDDSNKERINDTMQ